MTKHSYRLAWQDPRAEHGRSYLRMPTVPRPLRRNEMFICHATRDEATTYPTAIDALRALVNFATVEVPVLYGDPNWTQNVFATAQ